MRKLISFTCILLSYIAGFAQSGTPDPTFGNGGYIATPGPVSGAAAYSFAKQCFVDGDGKLSLVIQELNKTTIAKRLPNGNVDASYRNNGFSDVVSMIVSTAAKQADGKIVVAGSTNGSSDFMLARYKTDGTLDATFGNSGVVITGMGPSPGFLSAIVIAANGKIIVGGSTQLNGYDQFVLLQYTSAGILDGNFGNNGRAIADFGNAPAAISSLAVQANGKIVAAGTVSPNGLGDFALARFNANGSPDLSFNSTGTTTTDFGFQDGAASLVIDKSGKIIVGGFSTDAANFQHFRIARYLADGSPDFGFNGGQGSVLLAFGDSYDYLISLRLQADGKLVAAGHTTLNSSNYDIELARINADGSVDNNFGTNGNGFVSGDINSGYEECDFLFIQQDGKIVTGGLHQDVSATAFCCFRFNTDGTPDAGFGTGGNFLDVFPTSSYTYNALFRQADGKLLATGETIDGFSTKQLMSRFNIDGTPDTTYSPNGTRDLDYFSGVSNFQPDGKLLRLGYSPDNNGDILLLRYNSDGSPDAGFGNNGVVEIDFGGDESPGVFCFQPDGKIVVGGLARDENGSDFLIIRYNPDGSLDGSFGNGGFVKMNIDNEDQVQSITVAPDGKIVFGGTGYVFPPDYSYFYFDILIARLNPDGSVDTQFGDQGKLLFLRGISNSMGNLQVQTNNKIVFTYYVFAANGHQDISMQRLNENGSVDNSFGENGTTVCDGGPIFLQDDQKIIVAGSVVNNQNNQDFSLARFDPDGHPDPSFGTNGKMITSFTGVDNNLFVSLLSGKDFFAAGNGVDKKGLNLGLIAKFRLESASISCPPNQVVNTDKNLCGARVYNIDPSVTLAGTTVKYKLTGATRASGSGSVSGKIFNKGVTTVTYKLSNDEKKTCTFTVTVKDNELPVITDLNVSQMILWPPDHKYQDIFIDYSASDNCGIACNQVSVSSNEPVQGRDREDQSPDWQIIDNHHIRLRAERLENGNGRIYTIKITTTDVSGNQNTATATVTVPKSGGKQNQNCSFTFSAAPNPSDNYFRVSINSTCRDKINLRLLNNKGVVLWTICNASAPQTFKFGDRLKEGIYYLEASQSGVTKSIKLLKQ